MNDADRTEKENEQRELLAKNDLIYLGNGPDATGGGPGWRMASNLYLKCVLCGYLMGLDTVKSDDCFCGALVKDTNAGRLGSRLGDAGIEVYEARPRTGA